MKKRIAALVTAGVLALSMLTGCGSKQESWKVTCPWAPSGVAAMVSQKAAAKSPDYSDNKITLVAEAVKGDAATVNTWVSSTKANDKELVFAGEGLFAITETLDADDFLYDMQKDPWQLNNVVADPAYADVKAELRERLLNWIQHAEGTRPTITD